MKILGRGTTGYNIEWMGTERESKKGQQEWFNDNYESSKLLEWESIKELGEAHTHTSH